MASLWSRITKEGTFLGCLKLAEGTSQLNFAANSRWIQCLSTKELLKLISLVAVFLWGLASDKIGRRAVYVLSFTLMGLALCTYTLATTVYPSLLLLRLLFAIGGSAASSMLTAVLADYGSDQDRSKTAGLVGLMSGSGALLALFVFLPMPSRYGDVRQGLRTTFWIVGGVSIVFGGFLVWALRDVVASGALGAGGRDGSTEPMAAGASASGLGSSTTSLGRDAPPSAISADSTEAMLDGEDLEWAVAQGVGGQEEDASPSRGLKKDLPKTFFELAKEGVLAARDTRILLGYMGAFLARGDTVILTLFIPLWVYKSYIDAGLCDAPSPDAPDVKDVCRNAYIRASALSGIAQTFALIGAPFFGWLGDRFYGPFSTIISAFIGFVSYGVMFLIDPLGTPVWITVCFVGLAEIGMVVGSLALVTSSARVPRSIRGSVAGVSSACGALGILISSKVGGVLFDSWREGAPFFILAIGHFVTLVGSGGGGGGEGEEETEESGEGVWDQWGRKWQE
ncbi:hypothetical protein HK101_006759 [Irineochytrium annulatum]|nr:hypothetical protein HK101_006759 [Irineochytrium annulatum]